MLATAAPIARSTLGRATPLANPNAPSRALYGLGVVHSKGELATVAPARGETTRATLGGAPHRPTAHP